MLPLPLPSAGPALATVPFSFDPPALPIQFEYQQAQLEAETGKPVVEGGAGGQL